MVITEDCSEITAREIIREVGELERVALEKTDFAFNENEIPIGVLHLFDARGEKYSYRYP